jgi:hypothetical protein
MPAVVVGQLFAEGCQRLKAEPARELPKEWHHLQESFSALLAVMVPPWKSFVKRLKS